MNYSSPHQAIELAVMFADIAGSTSLFEKVGDDAAKTLIDQCLSTIITIIKRYQGEIVKTIGDEVMCRFMQIDNAAQAAIEIQNQLQHRHVEAVQLPLKVRIGMHSGKAIVDKGDIFGDVVNVAARIADIAQGGQIIVTESFARNISEVSGVMTRIFDRVKVKGKQDEITVYEILWQQNDQTVIISTDPKQALKAQNLILQYQQNQKQIKNTLSVFSLGREKTSDLYVDASFTSRKHAKIEYHRGKFVLIDESTNGTYVRDESGQEIYLRREELPLTGHGIISLGSTIQNNPDHLINYQCP